MLIAILFAIIFFCFSIFKFYYALETDKWNISSEDLKEKKLNGIC